ncbi:MAG: DUF5103 domain-containing protein [Candidatus Dadabacteria bacterium]
MKRKSVISRLLTGIKSKTTFLNTIFIYMKTGRNLLFLILIILLSGRSFSQATIYSNSIKSIKLYKAGDQTAFPAIALGSGEVLQLAFDDLTTSVRNYYYTYVLCNADWTPSMLHSFEYTRGFDNNRITTYRNSSLASTHYVHYEAVFPDRNSYPTKSGNYLLKVFLNNDTSRTVFEKRFVVYTSGANVAAQVQQPFNATLFRTGQKLQVVVTTEQRITPMAPTDIKVAILQNNNWATSLFINRPTITRGNYYEYSDEAETGMMAGREFRWIDLRSIRLMSDRMQSIENKPEYVVVNVKPEAARQGEAYVFYRDYDGSYSIESMENINPFWQADYAQVRFTYLPPNRRPIEGTDVYIFGEMTNYAMDSSGKMTFNPDKGVYEKTLLLKQGYYNYLYATRPVSGTGPVDFSQTEGNFWATENSYIILVYYRPFGARSDEVIGYASLSSVFQRQGF